MPVHPPHPRLLGRLTLETDVGVFLGDTRIRLLEAIDRCGSISRAAKTLPISYKTAWDAVDAMNNLADQPLVERSAGGAHGGGTTLTDYGRRMVAFYRAIESNSQELLESGSRRLGEAGAPDLAHFRRLLRRLAMKTSARNQFVGPVSSLESRGVHVEVRLRLDAENELAATVTRESASHLGLKIGDEIHAFVKAPAVQLARSPAPAGTNRFHGTVARLSTAGGESEVCVLLPSGRSIIALVASDALAAEQLVEGAAATAIIPASSVLLVSFD